MKIIFAMSFLVAHADVGQAIERSTSAIKRVGTGEGCTTCGAQASTATGQASSKIVECLNVVCPTRTNTYADVIDKFTTNAAKPSTIYDVKFGTMVDKLLRDEAQLMNEADKRTLELIARAPKITDPAAIRLFNATTAFQYASNVTTRTLPNGQMAVDVEASRSAFGKVSEDVVSTNVTALNHIFKLASETAPFETDDPVQLKIFHTEEETFAKIKSVIAEVAERKVAMEADPEFDLITKNPIFWSNFDPARMKRWFEEGVLESDSLSRLNTSYVMLRGFQDLKTDGLFREQMTSAPIDIKTFAQTHDLENKIKERIKIRTESLRGAIMPGADTCRAAYESAQVILPSKADFERARPAIDSLKDNFMNSISTLVCSSDRQALKDHGAEWKPVFAQDPADFERKLAGNLNLAKGFMANVQSDAGLLMASGKRDSYALTSLAVAETDNESDIQGRCRDIAPSYFPDGTDYKSKGYVVGPSVLHDVEKHEGVTYHELGHKFWGVLSAGQSKCAGQEAWFKDVRRCLKDNHLELKPEDELYNDELVKAGKPTRFEEEDWADLISARVDAKTNNFACLLNTSFDETSAKEMSLRASGTDKHASVLFRILHQEFLKRGQVPQACREAVAEKGEKMNFKNCLQVPTKTADGAQ